MTALPLASALTRPVADTVATAGLEDDHVAAPVTSCTPPVARVATAVNCDDEPTPGMPPDTVTADTDVAAVGEFPHAATRPSAARQTSRANDRIFMMTP